MVLLLLLLVLVSRALHYAACNGVAVPHASLKGKEITLHCTVAFC